MSLQAVRQVLHRAGTDSEFRRKFFQHRDEVLSAYDLTKEERQCLGDISSEDRLATVCQQTEQASGVHVSDIRI
jgi:hypothetical protein